MRRDCRTWMNERFGARWLVRSPCLTGAFDNEGNMSYKQNHHLSFVTLFSGGYLFTLPSLITKWLFSLVLLIILNWECGGQRASKSGRRRRLRARRRRPRYSWPPRVFPAHVTSQNTSERHAKSPQPPPQPPATSATGDQSNMTYQCRQRQVIRYDMLLLHLSPLETENKYIDCT